VNIQVTTRCNMRCIHCCFDCTAKGDDMPWDLFVHAVDLAHRANDDICIGGGEPTLHPRIVQMVQHAVSVRGLSIRGYDHVMIITNGTCSRRTWRKLIEIPHVDISVSNDIFHNPRRVQPWVRRWADEHHAWWNQDDFYQIDMIGRAARNKRAMKKVARKHNVDIEFDAWTCPEVRVTPTGQLFAERYDVLDCGPFSLAALIHGYHHIDRKDLAQTLELYEERWRYASTRKDRTADIGCCAG